MITANDTLIALAYKHQGNWRRILEALKGKERPSDYYIDKAKNLSSNAITILSPEYPESLKNAPQPPMVIFFDCLAETARLGDTKFAFLTKAKSEYAKGAYEKVKAKLMLAGFTILEVGISPIAITATSKLGEYTMRLNPTTASGKNPTQYVELQKLCATLAQETYVFEAPKRGSNMLSVSFALYAGREIYALPHPYSDVEDECNTLISEGANMISPLELE